MFCAFLLLFWSPHPAVLRGSLEMTFKGWLTEGNLWLLDTLINGSDFMNCALLMLSLTVHGWLTYHLFCLVNEIAYHTLNINLAPFTTFTHSYPWYWDLFTINRHFWGWLSAEGPFIQGLAQGGVVSSMMNCLKTDPIISRLIAGSSCKRHKVLVLNPVSACKLDTVYWLRGCVWTSGTPVFAL